LPCLLEVDETFQVTTTSGKFIKDISPEQKIAFTKIYSDTLLKFKCKSVGGIFHINVEASFYQQVNLQFSMLGFEKHWRVTKFSFAPSQIEAITLYRSEINIAKAKQAKLNVNNNLVKSMAKEKLEFREQLITLLITIDKDEQGKCFKVL